MAVDLKRFFIKTIDIKDLFLIGSPLWTTKRSYKWTNHKTPLPSKYQKRPDLYIYGTLSADSGCVHLEYMRYTKTKGDLLLTTSLPELYHDNNSHFLSQIEMDDLEKRVLNEIRFVIDISKVPPIREWGISRDELTFDIPDIQKNNLIRYENIRKFQKLPYKKIDRTYEMKGTIQFHSGENSKNAGVILIVYQKDLQQASKGNDLSRTLGLPDNFSVLRIEEKTKGGALKFRINKTRTRSDFAKEFTNLEISLSIEHQNMHIKNFIESLYLDKKIVTKKQLYGVIDGLRSLSTKKRKTCKRVIRFLNGEIKTIALTEKMINAYAKIILETGYSCFYGEIEVPAVGLDEETGKCIIQN